jgi:hypothetical protein
VYATRKRAHKVGRAQPLASIGQAHAWEAEPGNVGNVVRAAIVNILGGAGEADLFFQRHLGHEVLGFGVSVCPRARGRHFRCP